MAGNRHDDPQFGSPRFFAKLRAIFRAFSLHNEVHRVNELERLSNYNNYPWEGSARALKQYAMDILIGHHHNWYDFTRY